ncbi:MAG: hdc [Chlamydiia bacterium]|nr:hdc [Chlamydiia bacterium]
MDTPQLSSEDQYKLDDLYQRLVEKSHTFLGYPTNANLHNEELARFLNLTINNVGDPYIKSNYGVNTLDFECEVLEFFADLLKIGKEDYWGYATNGGTEGNMYGLYLAREKYSNGILYFSKETHYSIHKIANLLNMETRIIQTVPSGEMDYEDLQNKLISERPALFNLNAGTTMKGAICDIPKLERILKERGIKDVYIHCDAALFGIMLPYMDGAPQINFTAPIDSISISGHKFLGAPMPCGIVLCKKASVDVVRRHIEYIGSHDCTISGSRDGFSVLVLWMSIKKYGHSGIKKMVEHCLEMTQYAICKLTENGHTAWANPYSNTVVIDKPSDALIKKWQLATEGSIAHLVLMPHVQKPIIDQFVKELGLTELSKAV